MVVTLGQQYNVGEKPTVILYTYICILAGTTRHRPTVVSSRRTRIRFFRARMLRFHCSRASRTSNKLYRRTSSSDREPKSFTCSTLSMRLSSLSQQKAERSHRRESPPPRTTRRGSFRRESLPQSRRNSNATSPSCYLTVATVSASFMSTGTVLYRIPCLLGLRILSILSVSHMTTAYQ